MIPLYCELLGIYQRLREYFLNISISSLVDFLMTRTSGKYSCFIFSIPDLNYWRKTIIKHEILVIEILLSTSEMNNQKYLRFLDVLFIGNWNNQIGFSCNEKWCSCPQIYFQKISLIIVDNRKNRVLTFWFIDF